MNLFPDFTDNTPESTRWVAVSPRPILKTTLSGRGRTTETRGLSVLPYRSPELRKERDLSFSGSRSVGRGPHLYRKGQRLSHSRERRRTRTHTGAGIPYGVQMFIKSKDPPPQPQEDDVVLSPQSFGVRVTVDDPLGGTDPLVVCDDID